jgi:hypothetical protein
VVNAEMFWRENILRLRTTSLAIYQCISEEWLDEAPGWFTIGGLFDQASCKLFGIDEKDLDIHGAYQVDELGETPTSFEEAKVLFLPFLARMAELAARPNPPLAFIAMRLQTFACMFYFADSEKNNQ